MLAPSRLGHRLVGETEWFFDEDGAMHVNRPGPYGGWTTYYFGKDGHKETLGTLAHARILQTIEGRRQ